MTTSIAHYDPFDPDVIESPWAFFAALRHESPLYELPNKAYYLISRYDDVVSAAMDTQTYSSNLVAIMMHERFGEAPELLNIGGENMDALATADPPAHTRQRRVSNRTFTRRRVAGMQADIRALANELLDPILSRGQCDWVAELAVPLPMTIIIRLLGLPLEDLPQLKRWSDLAISLLSGINTAEELVQKGTETAKMIEYLERQVSLARSQPRDGIIGDLIREAEADSEALSHQEIVSILPQLLTAGNETTTSLISSAVMLMLRTPGMQQQLRDHPERIDAFIEEVLRLETPLLGHFRLVKRDTRVGGSVLPAGSRVMLLWASANRDESAFASPDQIDLDRSRQHVHTAFGYGLHLCIGAALARMEARIALETLLARTRRISLAPGNDFRHVPSLMVRGLERLLLDVEPASR